jgi:NitT/TauT family transport system substrate-binding protein
MASDKTLAERPAVVARFLKVFRQAVQLMHDDPGAAAQAVKTTVPQADLAVVRAQVDATIPLLINEISQRDGLGVFNPELLKKSWEWVANAHGIAVDKIDPMTTVNTRLGGS